MRFKSLVVVLAAASLATAGCSSSSKSAGSKTTDAKDTTTTAATVGAFTRPACKPKPSAPVVATKVAGSTSDYDITSFDGTKIRAHWFPLPAGGGITSPTILKGPGWGQPGDTNTAGSGYGLFGDLSIHALNRGGYNVLTWDPRGFGKSGGTVESDSADFEGRDVEQLISWISQLPGVKLDGPNDPLVGMAGASYGGGIQLVTAAIDCRVDAIVPQIAWHSLGTSLYKAETVKRGWGDILYSAANGHSIDPHITSAHTDGDVSNVLTAADKQWFLDRGPGDDLIRKINAPTLFEQGTIDTLFSLDEAVSNYNILRDRGVPTAMLWMCSGHGVCLTDPGDQQLPGSAALAWLDHFVKDKSDARFAPFGGSSFEYVDQAGVEYTADNYPPRASSPITANGSGALTMVKGEGSGPAHATGNAGIIGSLALAITPAKAAHAANIPITVANAANIVGAPKLTLAYSGTAPASERPTRIFAQLVDDKTGIVLGNQITPIAVTLDGKQHTTTTPLEMVAFTAAPGAHLTLQLVATTTAYAEPRVLGGKVTFDSVKIELPTVTGVTKQAK